MANAQKAAKKLVKKMEKKPYKAPKNIGHDLSKALNNTAEKTADVARKAGAAVADKVDSVAKGTKRTIDDVKKKGKEIQVEWSSFVDKQINKKFYKGKIAGFEDGFLQGKLEAVDQIKIYVNYILAVTALLYYFSKCDGSLSEEENQVINKKLYLFIKNKDLPDKVSEAIKMIAEKESFSFSELMTYLDNIGDETLMELKDDVDEIINADMEHNDLEIEARRQFIEYCNNRVNNNG